jgi:hypothetical protein
MKPDLEADAELAGIIEDAVHSHGTLWVLRIVMNATDTRAGVLGARGDVVGANDLLRRSAILKQAYKDWSRP